MTTRRICECSDREALHLKGTGPCLVRGCHCQRFEEADDA